MHVLCTGLFRSGSTWQYQVVAELIERRCGGKRLGFQGPPHPCGDEWTVVKWHDPETEYADMLVAGTARGVYAYRDLRDVTFSMMHKGALSFEQMVVEQQRMVRCVEIDEYWTSQPNMLVQRYEDLMCEPSVAIEQIASHIGIEIDHADALDLSQRLSLRANLDRTKVLAASIKAQGVDLDDANAALLYDQHSLLHWNHVRTGAIGGWRQEATLHQRMILAEQIGDWLIRRGYESDFTWGTSE